MKSWKASSLPVHATPTKLTWPANCVATSSTEGASRLQVLQVGAQNQNAVGIPATAAPSNVPPPTRGALNCRMSGTTTASVGVGAAASSVAVGAVGAALSVGGADVGESEPASAVSPATDSDVTGAVASSESADPHAASSSASAAAAAAVRCCRSLGLDLTARTVVIRPMPRATAPPSFRNCS